MKLFEHREKEETLDRLPDLPSGVEVPDDISGIAPRTTLRPTAGRIRWMHWLAAIVLLGAAGLVTAMLLRSDETVETTVVDPVETPVVEPVELPNDLMAAYGTDNPAFVEGSAGPGSVEIVAPVDYMQLYGTDNPVFVPQAEAEIVDTGEYMRLYGTDNPVFPPEPSYMELYGTDNPVFVD